MRTLLVLAFLILNACATVTEEKYRNNLDTWINNSEDNLISAWGVPDQVYKMDSGGKLITYNKINGTVFRWGAAIQVGCKTTFQVSASHVVETYRYEGNACKSDQ